MAKVKIDEVNCYEANEDGSLTIWAESWSGNKLGAELELIIPAYDVARMMDAGIDALQKKPSRR